jgi:hypothetical protein
LVGGYPSQEVSSAAPAKVTRFKRYEESVSKASLLKQIERFRATQRLLIGTSRKQEDGQ